jgi:glutaredoxin 3
MQLLQARRLQGNCRAATITALDDRFLRTMTTVRMYTTRVCPYCTRAKALLQQRGVTAIDEVRVDLEPAERLKMVELTGRRTVPQIFIGERHVGGCDELMALDRRGGLAPLLAAR